MLNKIIACTLNKVALKKRKKQIRETLLSQTTEIKELEDGYQLVFLKQDTIKDNILLFIEAEKKCCSFFNFELDDLTDAQQLTLNITGPEGVKTFITQNIHLTKS